MSRVNRDDIDKFHDYGIYIPQRTIYMGSEAYTDDGGESGTDHFMAERIVKNLLIMDSLSAEPINIIMNNLGGDVIHGMAIYDAIQACRSHVVIKVFGHAMSMGSIILQAADERIMAPNSKVMIHYGTVDLGGHVKNVEKWVEEGKRDDKWMEQMYLFKIQQKQPHFSMARLKERLKFDTILNAQEAVDLGLADKILGEE